MSENRGSENRGSEKTGSEDELLTVAEAAARLGVTERAVRRRLARPEYAAQTVPTTRRTRTGTRTAAALPPPLMAVLAAEFETERDEKSPTEKRGAVNTEKPEEHGQKPEERGGQMAGRDVQMAVVYETLLREKDARLADQSARIEYLEAALTREQEALAREQSLRLLTHTEDEAQEPEADTPPKVQRQSWWLRLWRRE